MASAATSSGSRRSFTIKEKLEIIEDVGKRGRGGQVIVAKQRNLAVQTVSRIWKAREDLLRLAEDGKVSDRKHIESENRFGNKTIRSDGITVPWSTPRTMY
jgi:hypothetical protein